LLYIYIIIMNYYKSPKIVKWLITGLDDWFYTITIFKEL